MSKILNVYDDWDNTCMLSKLMGIAKIKVVEEECTHSWIGCACQVGIGLGCKGLGICNRCGDVFPNYHPPIPPAFTPFNFSVGGLAPMDTNKYCPACGLERTKCKGQVVKKKKANSNPPYYHK